MFQPNQRVRVKTWTEKWIEMTTVIENPLLPGCWICCFDDGSVGQWPSNRLQPIPVEPEVPLTPEVF